MVSAGVTSGVILLTGIPNPLGYACLAVAAVYGIGSAVHKRDKLIWKYEDVINEMADKITNEFVQQHKYQIIYKTN